MNANQLALIDSILADFKRAYRRFLIHRTLIDAPVIRAGFYSAAEVMVQMDPIPDAAVQREVLIQLEVVKTEAMDGFMDDVERIFTTTAKETAHDLATANTRV